MSSLYFSDSKTTSNPKSRTLPHTPTALPCHSQAGTLPTAHGGLTPSGPHANCPGIRHLDFSAFSWSLKGLSGEEGESARPWALPLRNGQGANRPTGSGEPGHQQRGVSAPTRHPLDRPWHQHMSSWQENRARKEDWTPSQAGSFPQARGSLEEQVSLCSDPPSSRLSFPEVGSTL